MAEQSDLDGLKGILLGLGLTQLPKLLENLHKARGMGNHVDAGRTHKGTNPEADALHSALAPLLAQMGQAGMTTPGGSAPPSPEPPVGPGMRPGAQPPALPPMPQVPRTLSASAGPGGW